MRGGPTIRQQIDRRPVDVVVLVLQRLFFQTVDKHLEIGLGDTAEECIRRCVVEINHRVLQPFLCNSALRAFTSRLTRADGGGLVSGNRIVPFEISYPLSSVACARLTAALIG